MPYETDKPDLQNKADRRSILVVDDKDYVRDAIVLGLRALTKNNCYTARNGIEALEILKSRSIDLVITDVNMPKSGGKELFSAMKETYSRVPVIVMSGYATIEDGRHFLAEGAFDYLLKPISLKELVPRVNRALRAGLTDVPKFSRYDEERHILRVNSQGFSEEYNMHLSPKGYKLHFASSIDDVFDTMVQNRMGVVVWKRDNEDPKKFIESLKLIKDTFPFAKNIVRGSGSEKDRQELTILPDIMKLAFNYMPEENSREFVSGVETAYNYRIDEINKVLFHKEAEPHIWAIAGARAAGKTSTIDGVVSAMPCTFKLIRHSSRKPRTGEVDGQDHYFVDEKYFQNHRDDFVYTFKHQGSDGKTYLVGFEKDVIDNKLRQGLDVLLTFTDPESFIEMKKYYPEWKSIYIQSDPDTLYDGSVKRDGIRRCARDLKKEYGSFTDLERDNEFDFIIRRRARSAEDEFPMRAELQSRIKVICSAIQGRRLERIIRSEIGLK